MHPSLRSSLAKNLAIACAVATLTAAPAAMAAGAPKAYRFTATANNTNGSYMTLDHPALNGNSKLNLIVTQYFTGVYNPHAVGVEYNAATKKWMLNNEDVEPIPVNANFNVMIAQGAKRISVTPTNVNSVLAFFPTQKGNPNAKLLLTHLINPVLTLNGIRQPNSIGLYYIPASTPASAFSGRWSLYQENGDCNVATVFNVADVTNLKVGANLISFRHSARDANTTDLETTITNPLTDNNPNAVLFVQHVFTPGAATNADEFLGVRYADGKWRILTQDKTDKLAPVDFNIVAFPAVSP